LPVLVCALPIVAEEEVAADDPGREAFDEGHLLYFQGQYKEAAEAFETAVAEDPASATYRLFLARAMRCLQDDERAAEILQGILDDQPEHVNAGVELAEIFTADQEYEKVLKVLSPLLQYRHEYLIYHLLAEAYYNLERLQEAREHFEEAVRLNPESGGDYYQLGNIYLAQGRFARAAEAYDKARRSGIDSALLHYKLAGALFNLRDYLGHVQKRTVHGGQPGSVLEFGYLIDAVPAEDDGFLVAPAGSAIYHAEKALELGINDPALRFMIGNIWLNVGRYRRAMEIYDTLEDTIPEPESALFHFRRAQAAFGLGELGSYLKNLEQAIDLEPETYRPNLVHAYLRVAERHNQQGDQEKYITFLRKAVAENPDSASLHYRLAGALLETGDRAGAVREWRAVLELQEDHPDRLKILNQILQHSA
jgi:tetratricopeptide (TPR) repeat protein